MYNVDKPEAERKFRRANPIEIPKDVLKSILEETTSSKLSKILKKAIKRKTSYQNNNEYIVSSLFKYLKADSRKYIELIIVELLMVLIPVLLIILGVGYFFI